MEKFDAYRDWLVKTLRNSEIYLITKNNFRKRIFSLQQVNDEIAELNKRYNLLTAKKVSDSLYYGYVEDLAFIEKTIDDDMKRMRVLLAMKKNGNLLDISEKDSIQEIADKLSKIYNDDEFFKSEEDIEEYIEEDEYRNSMIHKLKLAKEKGPTEELKFIRQK